LEGRQSLNELARIEAELREGRFLLRIVGEVDISNAHALAEAIENAVPNDTTTVLVDLAQTTYLDSAGVQLLIQLSERLKARRHELRVVVPEGAPVRAVLELAGLAKVIPLESPRDAGDQAGSLGVP